MSVSHSDALVFFGATGDLAYKKIFPALQAMAKRGHLNVPVIGVAKATSDAYPDPKDKGGKLVTVDVVPVTFPQARTTGTVEFISPTVDPARIPQT